MTNPIEIMKFWLGFSSRQINPNIAAAIGNRYATIERYVAPYLFITLKYTINANVVPRELNPKIERIVVVDNSRMCTVGSTKRVNGTIYNNEVLICIQGPVYFGKEWRNSRA